MPCRAYVLYLAISNASNGKTLNLAPGCTSDLPDALPCITGSLTIVGYHSTLTRTWNAGSFSLLLVGATETSVFTVINVNFTNGGGHDLDYGGAIYNDGTLRGYHITITANDAGYLGGGIYDGDGVVVAGPATLTDSAVFGNLPDNCYPFGSVQGCFG